MIEYCQKNLEEIRQVMNKVDSTDYSRPLEILSGASIGQHIRHILELYSCFLKGLERDEVDYDTRARNAVLETSNSEAVAYLDEILLDLNAITQNRVITLKGNFSCSKGQQINIISSVYRELAYNLEHSIHHQSLIRIGLKVMGLGHLIADSFGVAPATLRYRENLQVSAQSEHR